jgi:tetratricopeptide (TPR) repeat protein
MSSMLAGTVLLAAISLPIGGTPHRKAEEGNRLYDEKAYEEALRAYTEGQVAAPEAPEFHYDIGNVLYRQGKFDAAGEAFNRALLSAPPSLAPLASYNLGNALFRQERYEDAVKAFRRTLEVLPDDGDAKQNLELALRAIEQQKQSREQQQQQQRQDNQQQQQQKQQEQQQQQGQQPEPSGGENERSPGSQSGSREGKMTPEQAKRLLDTIQEQEKQDLRRKAQRQVQQEEDAPEKDW